MNGRGMGEEEEKREKRRVAAYEARWGATVVETAGSPWHGLLEDE